MSYGQIRRAQRFSSEDSALDGIRAHGRNNLLEQYAYVESVLGDGRDWVIPEAYTVVDPYVLVFFQWGQRIGITMRDSYPHWSAITDRILAQPAVQRTLQSEGVIIA